MQEVLMATAAVWGAALLSHVKGSIAVQSKAFTT